MPKIPVELTSSEASAELDVHPSTLSRWVASGYAIPSRKLPGLRGPFLFSQTEVKRLKREQEKAKARRSQKAGA